MFLKLFKSKICNVIAMIHVDALPGTPKYAGSFRNIIEKARSEAEIYKKCGIDAVMIENMHDVPYVQSQNLGPEVIASMTRIALEVKNILPNCMPCGIQILACGNKEAVAVAKAAQLNFIRAEGFVFAHVADEGFTNANAGELLRYRKFIGADNIMILTDIKKKHSSHSITTDVSLVETAHAADFFLSDGVIVTGNATGSEADIDEIKSLEGHFKIPIIIGSGITFANIDKYYKHCNAAIVGSHFKKDGHWSGELCTEKINAFMAKVRSLRD